MKKYSPGCLCCGDDCEDACYFPCTGGVDAIDCLVCGIDIQLPTPDTVGLDPLLMPPAGCGEEAPCYACYRIFDRIFSFWFGGVGDGESVTPTPGDTCNNWGYAWVFRSGVEVVVVEDGVQKFLYIDPCWNASDYNCPYDNALNFYQCPSSNIAISTPWVDKGQEISITLTGNEWDGSCGKLTLQIRYAAVEYTIGTSTPPIEEPGECNDPKWTEFIHTFELAYCTCSSLFNAFTYVSTTTTDSCAGAVDDPCNFAGATITLKQRPERTAYCNVCNCLNCPGTRSDQVALTVSGPVISGTFILDGFFSPGSSLGETCQYIYSVPIEACPQLRDLQITLQCLACDLFKAFLSIQHVSSYTMWFGDTEAFGCGDTPTFSEIELNNGTAPCQLDGHTFQLSFVST